MRDRDGRERIAVIGSGISGLAAAWLLSRVARVTLFEAADRLGGHSDTVAAPDGRGGSAPVDMGFIVYNEANYPNLVAFFDHLGAPTKPSDMSFAVSLDDGALEYGGDSLFSLFAQGRNLVRPRFWSMLGDLLRFYRQAPGHACGLEANLTSLGDYLAERRYGRAFQNDHLLPQAAAIWSSTPEAIRDYPAAAFIRFFENHGLLQWRDRPAWRTVEGGSREYVRRLIADFAGEIRLATPVRAVVREASGGPRLVFDGGGERRFDSVVIAAHADQALAMLANPTEAERGVLGAIRYTGNEAVLHRDRRLMPKRRATWSAWNAIGRRQPDGVAAVGVTYWMDKLQGPRGGEPLFVSLNPPAPIDPERVIATRAYDHPFFDAAALRAQRRLWSLQGQGGVWFCGAWFGAGFHEDGLQAGLAVAEALGGVKRPWRVPRESGRIHLDPALGAAPPLPKVA